jgi:2TM domain
MTMLTADQYRQAEFGYTLAESRRGFKIHAAIYAVVITGLIALSVLLIAFTDANFPWAVFPVVGWGIGLTMHYIYGYRRAAIEIRGRQRKVNALAERRKEPV